MCGRYLLRNAPEGVTHTPWDQYINDIRFNVAPSQSCPILISNGSDGYELKEMTWGFRPHWMKQKSKAQINARSETAFEKPMFKHSAHNRRCLILANGFYEPKGSTQPKPWFCFRYPNWETFVMAGIWTCYPEEEDNNFAILTTRPNELMKPIHHRMPVILDEAEASEWLREDADSALLQKLCEPDEYPGMESFRVSDYVKNPRNQGEQCVQPL